MIMPGGHCDAAGYEEAYPTVNSAACPACPLKPHRLRRGDSGLVRGAHPPHQHVRYTTMCSPPASGDQPAVL